MDIPLGKATEYRETYAPELLAPMPRAAARAALGLTADRLPFRGEDVWNGYEFSWLDPRGMPRVAGLRLVVDADSPYFVESKSFKLYLNGFAQTPFASAAAVREVLSQDLAAAFGAPVALELVDVMRLPAADSRLPGRCLDDLDCPVERYERAPELLEPARTGRAVTDMTVHTHLFRSLCPVTGQPDWASVLVRYSGLEIEPESLWRYLLSYRRHPAFHETTVEQIFLDLKARCGCETLLVTGLFQRRGGLDINPVRTDGARVRLRYRLPRQ
jgi:7-cyano-7-deazaguanine reductase